MPSIDQQGGVAPRSNPEPLFCVGVHDRTHPHALRPLVGRRPHPGLLVPARGQRPAVRRPWSAREPGRHLGPDHGLRVGLLLHRVRRGLSDLSGDHPLSGSYPQLRRLRLAGLRRRSHAPLAARSHRLGRFAPGHRLLLRGSLHGGGVLAERAGQQRAARAPAFGLRDRGFRGLRAGSDAGAARRPARLRPFRHFLDHGLLRAHPRDADARQRAGQ